MKKLLLLIFTFFGISFCPDQLISQLTDTKYFDSTLTKEQETKLQNLAKKSVKINRFSQEKESIRQAKWKEIWDKTPSAQKAAAIPILHKKRKATSQSTSLSFENFSESTRNQKKRLKQDLIRKEQGIKPTSSSIVSVSAKPATASTLSLTPAQRPNPVKMNIQTLKRFITFTSLSSKKSRCDLCKVVVPKGYTNQHKIVHTKEQNYNCANCSKTFGFKDNCIRHQKSCISKKGKEKKFECLHDNCTIHFAHPSDLAVHMRKHTKKRPFKCPFFKCKSAFAANFTLTSHLASHSDERNYICSSCYSAYKYTGNCLLHIKNKHNNDNNAKTINLKKKKQNEKDQKIIAAYYKKCLQKEKAEES